MNSILLATSSAAFEQKVRRALGGELNGSLQRWFTENESLSSLATVRQLAEQGSDVVAIGPNVPVDMALEVTRAIDEERPEVGVILVAEPTPDLWERALHSGVRDVLVPDASDDQIRQTFNRALETAERRRKNLAIKSGVADFAGRVVTVVAPKGGVGKTALTTNLAVTLASRGEGRVALVDLDLQFGDVGSALGLEPENTIADLARVPGGVTATSLKVFLTRRDEKLFALCAPLSPTEEVSEVVVDKTIRLLAEDFEHVVIDTSAGLNEATLSAIDLSTDLVFLCDLSASALRGLRQVVDALDDLGVTSPTRHFVLNRADSKVGISPADAAAIVGMDVDVEVPTSQSVPLAMNYGKPVVEESPKSAVSLGFQSAADFFIDADRGRKHGFTFRRNR